MAQGELWQVDRTSLDSETNCLVEWEHVLQCCLTASMALSQPRQTPRQQIETLIQHSTRGRAHIWWEQSEAQPPHGFDRIVEVRYGAVRYGSLGLIAGYLSSTLLPGIPRCFADLCGVLMALSEHQIFVRTQAAMLAEQCVCEPLTRRERQVLCGLVCGESEQQTAERLGISEETVRRHRHRLYETLGVARQPDLHSRRIVEA